MIGPDTLELLDNDSVWIIAKYYVPIADSSSKDRIVADFKSNPFMHFGVGTSHDKIGDFFNRTLTSVGGLDVTNIANGVAQFMIKRAKEELTITFFDRFKKFSEENPEFQVLFPKTTNNLQNLLSYHYPDMLNVLRKGFMDDLDQLVFRLDDVLALPRYQALLKNFPEIRIAIRSIRLVQELETRQRHPADIITEFAGFSEWTDPNAGKALKNFGGAVKVGNLISQSLRSTDSVDGKKRAWIRPTQLDSLIQDTVLFKIYMGLLYQQSVKDNIQFFKADGTPKDFAAVLGEQKDKIFLMENNLVKFIQLAEQVQNALNDIHDKKKDDVALTNDDYYSYINTGINVIEFGFDFSRFFDKDLVDVGNYTKLAKQANDLYRNIYQKQYPQAVTNAMTIFQEVVTLVKSSSNEKVQALHKQDNTLLKDRSAFLGKNKSATIDNLNADDKKEIEESVKKGNPAVVAAAKNVQVAADAQDSLSKLGKILAKLNKYGLFAANMANAKTPDEVSSILENAVLPVGSSSIKKVARWNLSVQSYLGAYRMVNHPKSDLNIAWTGDYGLIAPIGLSLSYGLGKGGSLSAFVPLLDLGAIVDFQLKYDSLASPNGNDSTINRDYKIKLGQIISPGFYLVYGAPCKIPVSLGFGAQYGPGLSKVNVDGTTQVNNPSWRINVFLAVDIPFFTIWNKPRNNQ